MFKKVITEVRFILVFCWVSLVAIAVLLICGINLDFMDIIRILALGFFPSIISADLLMHFSKALEYMKCHPNTDFLTAWKKTKPDLPPDTNDWA